MTALLTYAALVLAGAIAGALAGWIGAAFFATSRDANEYEGVEHSPPRVMPQIWDRLDSMES